MGTFWTTLGSRDEAEEIKETWTLKNSDDSALEGKCSFAYQSSRSVFCYVPGLAGEKENDQG